MIKLRTLIALLLFPLISFSQWEQLQNPSGGMSLAIERLNGNLFACVHGEGVMKYSYAQQKWLPSNTGLPQIATSYFGGLKKLSDTIFVYNTTTVYFSDDDGNTWQALPSPGFVFKISDIMVFNGKLYLSSDTWLTFGFNPYGVMRYEGNGNWTLMNNGLPTLQVGSLTNDGHNLYCGTWGFGVYKSDDEGANWSACGIPAGDSIARSISYSNGTLYAVTFFHGVYKADTATYQWNLVIGTEYTYRVEASGDKVCYCTVSSIRIDGNNQNSLLACFDANDVLFEEDTVWAAGDNEGIYFSTDGGILWDAFSNGLNDLYVLSLVGLPDRIIASNEWATYYTIDGGNQWYKYEPNIYYYDCAMTWLFPIQSYGDLVIGRWWNGCVVSFDAGNTWTYPNNNSTPFNWLTDFAGFAFSPPYIYFESGPELYSSTNGGSSWTVLPYPLNNETFSSIAVKGDTLFVAGDYGIQLSLDHGLTWQPMSLGLGGVISMLNVGPDMIFSNGYLWISNDNCQTFDTVMYPGGIYNLVRNGNNLFGLSGYGNVVLYSTDHGYNWQQIGDTLPYYVTELTLNTEYLWAGTSGGGIWKYPLADLSISYVADTNHYVTVSPVPFYDNSVTVFPVPASDYVIFDVHLTPSTKADLYIFNTIGQLLFHFPLQKSSLLKIDAGNIGDDGLYLYKVTTNTDETIEGKFILNR